MNSLGLSCKLKSEQSSYAILSQPSVSRLILRSGADA